ncbi:MAG: hypothetical protein BWY24_00649 [Microgenomates group bacterium ADurb.Bin219]|nr:MAG: hypothetical protein BWY24_00649 [Microgenomates group bacterium ADurb.Bin219]HNP89161.1 hypothetical protein [Candidatus Woesebacteria bacterium]
MGVLFDGTDGKPNQVVVDEDPKEFIDVTVGCLGNVDKWGTTNHEKGRISRCISGSDLAAELAFFFKFYPAITPAMVEEKMKRQFSGHKEFRIMEAIKISDTGKLANPELCRELLRNFHALFIALTEISVGMAFDFLKRVISGTTNRMPEEKKENAPS